MKKNIIIFIGAVFTIFILTWIILIFLLPISIIEGKGYYTRKLKQLSEQRKTAYDELYISLNDEINKVIDIPYANIKSILEIFYTKSTDIDKTYYQLMTEYITNISFPLQNRKLCELIEIFPAYINAVKYNNQFYNEIALKLFTDQYENIIRKVIETKTNDVMKYIDYYFYYPKMDVSTISDFFDYKSINEKFFDYYLNQCLITNKIIDEINISVVNLPDYYLFNIPVTLIDNVYYNSIAINELQESMKIVSPSLIDNTKNILIGGINYQTEIYTENIDSYVDWFYSYFTSLGKTLTNIKGFFTGDKFAEEKYYTDNFNRIMNNNANFYFVINEDMIKQTTIINNIFNDYLDYMKYFSVANNQNVIDIMELNNFMEPFTEDIVLYYDQVFDALDTANTYYFQEYTIKDDNTINTVKTAVKLLSSVNFFGGILVDYLSLKNQKIINEPELRQKIFDSMMENQNNKIAIIHDPFDYVLDKLNIGDVLYVDNYFMGFDTYQHYGVYVGEGIVVHFAPLEGQDISFENGVIHKTTLDKFLNGRALKIDMDIKKRFHDNEIIQRAYSRLGEKGYDLFTNNCEHFARWCVTGENISYQVINSPQKIASIVSILKENYSMLNKFLELFN